MHLWDGMNPDHAVLVDFFGTESSTFCGINAGPFSASCRTKSQL